MLTRHAWILRLLSTLATIAVMGLTFSLGQWQTGRALYKENLQAAAMAANQLAALQLGTALVAPDEAAHRHVSVEGEFLPNSTVYLDNRFYQQQPGVHVLTAFRPDGAGAPVVVVNRGWMPLPPDQRHQVSAPAAPAGRVRVEGTAQVQIPSYWNLGAPASGKLGGLWPNFGFDAYAQVTGLKLQPFLILQSSAGAESLVRDWPRAGSGAEKHRGYAFQWYALCLLTLGWWLWFTLKPNKKNKVD
jgi:cytochrome oxidase assembly protein ShyY1